MLSLYAGSPVTHQSEKSVLEKIVELLIDAPRPAVIMANLTIMSRQIDIVVGIDDAAFVIEAKSRSRPIRGGPNGPWQVQVSTNSWKDFGKPTNPYVQARDAALQLKDEIERFESRQIKYPRSAVVFTPYIPQPSKIYSDHKVSVIGLEELQNFISIKKTNSGASIRWEAFAQSLRLDKISTVKAAIDPVLFDYETLLHQYSLAFLREYSHDEQVVPFICHSDGQDTCSKALVDQVAEERADLLLQGPSGCGKTLLATQAAVRFTENGGIVIMVYSRYYSGSIQNILNRESNLLVDANIASILRAANSLNRSVLFVVDGLNECKELNRNALLRGVASLKRKYETQVVITSQNAPDGPTRFDLRIVNVPLPTRDIKAEIVRRLSGMDVLDSKSENLLEVASTAFEAKIVGEIGRDLTPSASRFSIFDRFVRIRLGDFATEGIRLLSKVAGTLTDRVAFSITQRDLERLMDGADVPTGAATRLYDARLLTLRSDRVSFSHELFLDVFAAENVVRRASDNPDKVIEALSSPLYANRKAFILGAIDDDRMLEKVLGLVQDSHSVTACLSGACGIRAQLWADAQCLALLCRLRAEACEARFRLSTKAPWGVEFDESKLLKWTARELAVLNAVHSEIVNGRHLSEALEIIEILDRRISSENDRLFDELGAEAVNLSDGLFACSYVFPHKAPGISYVCEQLKSAMCRPSSDVIVQAFENWVLSDRLSPGQLFVILRYLCYPNLLTARTVQRAITAHWPTAPYHLRLELIDAVKMCRVCDNVQRTELINVVQKLCHRHSIVLSNDITEALVVLGDLEVFEDEYVSNIQEQIRRCLEDPESVDQRKVAINLYSAQFENLLGSAHSEAIDRLGLMEKKIFLGMAAEGATDEPIIRVPLLIELSSLCDYSDGHWFARWTAPVRTDEVIVGDGIAVFVAAHMILARLQCSLPERRIVASNQGSRELAACGEILYWCNRFDLSEAKKHGACGRALRVLVDDSIHVSLDVIRRFEYQHISNLDCLPGIGPVSVSILKSFPQEVIQICRRSLADPSRLITYYPALSEFDRRTNLTFAIHAIGLHGNSMDLPILRHLAGDPNLGSTAIRALRSLEERLTSS